VRELHPGGAGDLCNIVSNIPDAGIYRRRVNQIQIMRVSDCRMASGIYFHQVRRNGPCLPQKWAMALWTSRTNRSCRNDGNTARSDICVVDIEGVKSRDGAAIALRSDLSGQGVPDLTATRGRLVSCHILPRVLTAEIAIHFLGNENLNVPHVFAFPEIVVCLDCGSTSFKIAEAELQSIRERVPWLSFARGS
jgi:hypothetical protein